MVSLNLPEIGLAADMRVEWAKADMIKLLPVERALYLDSDVLVRGDLKQLWNIDLQGKAVGAVTDIGFPMGHDHSTKAPYFNAGVLLIDLAKARGVIDEVQVNVREQGFRIKIS